MSHDDELDLGAVPALFGDPEWRVEGAAKVTGSAAYAADLGRPGMLWAAFRRSDVPHARITAIRTEAAVALSGVHAVLTGAEIGQVRFGRRLLDQPVLAMDRVRFVGERVAAVAAESRAQADEAAQLVEVEYEELPAVFSPQAALAEDAPVLHPDRATYAYLGGERPPVPHPNIQGRRLVRQGTDDLAERFAAAPYVFEHEFATPRQHHGYLEPHACLVWVADDGVVHVVTSNKAPFSLRSQMAAALDLPPEQIDVDAAFIGGDFGGKGYSPDEYACYFLARASGRPVKAVMSYVEELAAANPRHAATVRLRTAVDGDGLFLAHDARVLFDGGAYAAAKPLPPLVLAGGVQTMAAYRVPASSIEVITAYTNTAPGGHMRAPGEVQALFAGESHVDLIARGLGIDPLELRLRNVGRSGEVGATGDRPREGRGRELLEALRERSGWGAPLLPGRGRGVALGLRHVGGGKAAVQVALERDGTISVLTGIPDQGGGAHTVIRRVLAAAASVAPERISVRQASTATAPFDPGVGGSRTTHLASQAAARAGIALRNALQVAASRTLGEAAEQVNLVDDWLIGERGHNRVSLDEAAPVLVGDGAPITVEGRYEAAAHGDDEPGDYDYGAYVAEVEVDPETGEIAVRDVTLAADVGTIVNPVAHQGQLAGGFVFGLGGALFEELVTEDGRVTTLNLGEYKLPTIGDVPPLHTILLPTRIGPGAWGTKMAGELSNAAVAPAIANAIHDAVGIRIHELPLTAERVHAALRARDG